MSDSRTLALAERIDRPTMGALAMTKGGPGVPIFASMTDILEFAKVMAVSQIGIRKHLRNNPGACAAICLQAQRWEMDPFMVANKSYEVNDQIAYEAQLLAAVINTRAPIKGKLKSRFEGEGASRKCIVWATFIGEEEPTEVESPPFSQIKPKNSPLWTTDPDQQLTYYTKRLWARRECPEVLLGVYDRDELAEEIRAETARDVTPPRPKLSDFAGQAGGVAGATVAEFDVTDDDGEIRSFDKPMDAGGFFLKCMQDASRARSIDGVEGLWESNATLITQLREADQGKLADDLKAEYSKLVAPPDRGAKESPASSRHPDDAPSGSTAAATPENKSPPADDDAASDAEAELDPALVKQWSEWGVSSVTKVTMAKTLPALDKIEKGIRPHLMDYAHFLSTEKAIELEDLIKLRRGELAPASGGLV